MHKIHIKSEDRRGKSPDEAAKLILDELKNIDEADDIICFVVPAVWSWGHDTKVMQFCMSELVKKLINAVGNQFNIRCSRDEMKELSITATRVIARS